jgi:hypothetical protein
MFAASAKNGRPAGTQNTMYPRESMQGARGNAAESWAIATVSKSHRSFKNQTYGPSWTIL